jgi:FkbM family methyltransferase
MPQKDVDKMYYSQFGEDKILFEIFQRKTSGVCVEVGANNGVDDSTSLFFEKIGWKCILIEPNPILCQMIRSTRNALLYECAASDRRGVATLYVAEGAEKSHGVSMISVEEEEARNKIKSYGFTCRPVQVDTRTLDNILAELKFSSGIDFVSIDVEGHELEVLKGFSLERWRPMILLVEDNSNFENNIVSNYLKKFGYVRFMRTGVNDWYAHRTNKRLVNMRSKTKIKWLAWLAFKRRVKNKLLRIPLISKLTGYFRA